MKCDDVHKYYEGVEDKSARLRCTLCRRAWQQEVPGSAAPFPSRVTTLARASTHSLRMHLIREHGAIELSACLAPASAQSTLQAAYRKASLGKQSKASEVALAFAFNPTLTFSMLDDPWFRQAFGHPCSKVDVPKALFSLQNDLLINMTRTLQGLSREINVAVPLSSPLHRSKRWCGH